MQQFDQEIGIDWEWQSADGCIIKAPLGSREKQGQQEATGPSPTDRGKSGSKRHLLTDGQGIPLAIVITGANVNDMKELAHLLDGIVVEHQTANTVENPEDSPTSQNPADEQNPVSAKENLCLDRGYNYKPCQKTATEHGYTTHIPNTDEPVPAPTAPERHPARRWVVEVSHSWMNRFRRLLIRWEKKMENYLGFVQIATWH